MNAPWWTDPARQADFEAALWSRAEAGGDVLVATADGRAAVRPNPFNSDVFGLSMGDLTLLRAAAPERLDELLEALLQAARARGLAHLGARTRDLALVRGLERAGFRAMDVCIHFQRAGGVPANSGGTACTVAPLAPGEVDEVLAFGVEAFRNSRFYQDSALDLARADALHRHWLRNDLTGRAPLVLIAHGAAGVCGFIACLEAPAEPELGQPSRTHIDLIAVREGCRGAGAGTALVRAAVAAAAGEWVIVGTQGVNIPAQRMYLKCGFVPGAVETTLHCRL